MILVATAVLMGAGSLLANGLPQPALEPKPVFSTTVFGSAIPGDGLRGLVYELPPNTSALPYFAGLHPVATLYTKTLNIPPQDFLIGIPGVARVEWFAIDYTGAIWISKAGKYHFVILSDDGSRLYLDEEGVIDNDGVHPPVSRRGTVSLRTGLHRLRVSYFQGPRQTIALVLKVKGPGSGWRVFDTEDFKAPPGMGAPK